jgi:hypothetical protein
MKIYQKVYEFAASAGAFEGYVYRRDKSDLDLDALLNWMDNIISAYKHLPSEVREEIQSDCDQTLGRAFRSLAPVLGEGNKIVRKLSSLVKGELPESPDDFQKTKWFA